MSKRETEKAARLLGGRAERVETCGDDSKGGWCLTAHWRDGGQRLFHTITQVQEFLADREVGR